MAFSIDDSWDNCGPVARAGNAAFGVYCRCGAWVARMIASGGITEPVVPTEVAVAYGSPELAQKLVAAGLWEAVDGGWFLVHYLTRNESAEQVAARRKRDADRKKAYREGVRKGQTKESGRRPRGTRAGLSTSFTPPNGGKGAATVSPVPHAFDEATDGWCSCRLPRANKIHLRGGRAA